MSSDIDNLINSIFIILTLSYYQNFYEHRYFKPSTLD